MGIANDDIFNDIEHCGVCADHKPFHFEMGTQRVMLISFAPIYSSQHRPLYFIQLFREICLALFGNVAPSEKFIKEFYDPTGNIYWTHYQKCFKRDIASAPKCEPLLEKEIVALDPEVIIMLGNNITKHLYNRSFENGSIQHQLPTDKHPYIKTKRNGATRKVFFIDSPISENTRHLEEIRKTLKPYISWVKTDCENIDFSSMSFIDLEYASIGFMNEHENVSVSRISSYERDWIDKIILPNIRAYNLILQTFIFIESNIKNLLESNRSPQENIDKVWFSPFRELIYHRLSGNSAKSREQKQAAKNLIDDIYSLQVLRNIIVHKNGVIDERDEGLNLKHIAELRRLKGVYIYGGNSVFISDEGVGNILNICDRFRKIYKEHFAH